MTAKTNASETATPKAKRPTAEQLQRVTSGGSYVFNTETGKFDESRKPTASVNLNANKKEAK